MQKCFSTKMVERAGTSATTTTEINYTQKNGNVNRYSKELFPEDRIMSAEDIELDYVEHLLENPNNYSIKEEKSISDEGATGEKTPNTFGIEDAISIDSISKDKENVNRNVT